MHIHIVPNRGSSPTNLLRESCREGASVRKRTLANLSGFSMAQVAAIRSVRRGVEICPVAPCVEITATGTRGHVEAVVAATQRLGFAALIASRPCRERDLVAAMEASRIPAPAAKWATTRWWHTTTLAEDFGVTDASEDDLYDAMDWLLKRQDAIQKKLAMRHLSAGGLLFYDLSSSYFEGSTGPLARRGTRPVSYRLLADARGGPVAISVHEGNVSGRKTVIPEV